MNDRPRVLLVCSHPVQHFVPVLRVLAKDPRLDIQVAYCSMQGAEAKLDPDFGVEVKWDIPLLDGYPWVRLPNHSRKPQIGSFFGLFNPGVWQLISGGKFDAVALILWYTCATFWMAVAAAKWKGAKVFFAVDAQTLVPMDGKIWKLWVKQWLWPRLFRIPDAVLVPSSGSAALMRSLGIPEDRLALIPYSVDNDWWIEKSDQVNRAAVRARWGVPEDAAVILFCAKLQPWKRPQDVLRAFAKVAGGSAHLVFAGDGALRPALESEAQSLGIAGRVHFFGFVNQSDLPEVYTASDLLVLSSDYEAFGLVVNEAMLCRCPVVVSDHVGARLDLVREGETGYVYPCGDVESLAAVLRRALGDRGALRRMGEAARVRMASWSHVDYARGFVRAVSKAVGTRDVSA